MAVNDHRQTLMIRSTQVHQQPISRILEPIIETISPEIIMLEDNVEITEAIRSTSPDIVLFELKDKDDEENVSIEAVCSALSAHMGQLVVIASAVNNKRYGEIMAMGARDVLAWSDIERLPWVLLRELQSPVLEPASTQPVLPSDDLAYRHDLRRRAEEQVPLDDVWQIDDQYLRQNGANKSGLSR